MEKNFLPVRTSPFTNTCKSPLFCSPNVNISLFLMDNLQDWGFMGGISINSGFYWGSTTGIYYDILERRGVSVDGDAEPSAASGGCSEAEHP